MSLLLKAFPHGRPHLHVRRSSSVRSLVGPLVGSVVLALVTSLALVGVPLAGSADATTPVARTAAHHPHHAKAAAKKRAAKQLAASRAKARQKARPPRVPGQPPSNYVIPAGAYFSYPNLGTAARLAIRNRVLTTVRSVWGGPRDAYGAPLRTNGTIRLASWTFDDWTMARALVAAQKRGVSVQILVAKDANRGHASWYWLRSHLGHSLYKKGVPSTGATWSYARYCRGACRGRGGTAHSKYFLFDNVGAHHARDITVQTSMNLTTFAFTNQWNQAQVSHAPEVHADYLGMFAQSRLGRLLPDPYHLKVVKKTTVDYFFPRYNITPPYDPVMQVLAPTICTGATTSASGRTSVNVIQYAIYGNRGLWIAKRLRALWDAGCNVKIIYSIANRPVLAVLRSQSGRGPIPMRQSVITDWYGTITSYNHSKWMTIAGHWGPYTNAYVTFSGSSNWSDLAATDDEQMQRLTGWAVGRAYLAAFARTWNQRSSHRPGYGVMPLVGGRVIPTFAPDVPEGKPSWGKGVYRYMSAD